MKNVLFLLLLTTGIVTSQTKDSINKPKYIEVNVNETYERIVQKGYDSIEIYEYLGNHYFALKNYTKSKYYYSLLFQKYNKNKFLPKTIEQYNYMLKMI